jgi:hypothetical protein
MATVDESRAHPRWGIEFDWLAVDEQGHVAVFSSSGSGPVPAAVNAAAAAVDSAVDVIAALEVIGGYTDVSGCVAEDGDYTDWYLFSSQGFYAFQWDLWDGPYIRICSPTRPITISELSPTIAQPAKLVQFNGAFAESDIVTDIEYEEPSTSEPMTPN